MMFVELFFMSIDAAFAEAKALIEKGYLVFMEKCCHRSFDKEFYVVTYDKKQNLN